MTQASLLTQPKHATCATCPFFCDYNDDRGRGWCGVFDRHAFRHHRSAHGCRQALPALSEGQPLTVWVELVSHELDPDQDYPVPLHDFIAEVTVSKPSQQLVETVIANLGYSEKYRILRYWIPQTEDEF